MDDCRKTITVTQLKREIEHWPEINRDVEPTEVWVQTGINSSSPCKNITKLNLRPLAKENEWACDLLLEVGDCVFERSK